MPQVIVQRPLGELDLCNQLRFKPHTVFHLFLGQSPLGSLFLRQVGKRASVDFQPLEPARHFTANLRHKAVPHLSASYLITFSARIITTGGTVTPRALAVLRLIISSNSVGCSTGRSAGL